MEVLQREKVNIFSYILDKIWPVHINSILSANLIVSAVEVLIAFYENRLKDHYVITPPVLHGLRALVSVCVIDI